MLRTLRKARLGQIALGIAGLLAITGSFGLHPEPAAGDALLCRSLVPGWSAQPVVGGASHGCPACLAHRAVPITGLVDALVAPPLTAAARNAAPVAAPRVAPSVPHDGRAPPALD